MAVRRLSTATGQIETKLAAQHLSQKRFVILFIM